MDYPIKFADQLKQQLRALRKARGLNQTELGARIGVTQTRVAEIEANPGVVGMEQLIKIFAALGAELILRETEVPLLSQHLGAKGLRAGAVGQRFAYLSKPAEGVSVEDRLEASARHLLHSLHILNSLRRVPAVDLFDAGTGTASSAHDAAEFRSRLLSVLARLMGVERFDLENRLKAPAYRAGSLKRMVEKVQSARIEAAPPQILLQWAAALNVDQETLAAVLRSLKKPGLLDWNSKGSW